MNITSCLVGLWQVRERHLTKYNLVLISSETTVKFISLHENSTRKMPVEIRNDCALCSVAEYSV